MNIQSTPVLLLTGYLGSGKTTLLNRILNKSGGCAKGNHFDAALDIPHTDEEADVLCGDDRENEGIDTEDDAEEAGDELQDPVRIKEACMNGIVDHERALDQEPHGFHEQNDTVQHKQFARGRCAARTEQIHKADDDCQDADDEFRHQGSAIEEADDSENTENKHHDRKHGHYVKECTDRSGNTEKACDNKQNSKNNTCDNHTDPLSNEIIIPIIVPYCQRNYKNEGFIPRPCG